MTENYRKLEDLVKSGVIDLNHFYSINMSSTDIILQGHMSSDKMDLYHKCGFDFMLTPTHFIEAKFDGIRIVLT